jgi:hypothetical protein
MTKNEKKVLVAMLKKQLEKQMYISTKKGDGERFVMVI